MSNLPDDYWMYWQYCRKHNIRWHLSDGGCDGCIEDAQPPEEEITNGDKYLWLDDGKVQMSSKNIHHKKALRCSPGKWLLMIKDGRIYGARRYVEGEALRKDDILIQIPELKI